MSLKIQKTVLKFTDYNWQVPILEDVLSNAVAGRQRPALQGQDPRGVSQVAGGLWSLRLLQHILSPDAGRDGMIFAPALCVVASFVQRVLDSVEIWRAADPSGQSLRETSQEQVGQESVMNGLALAAEVTSECFERQSLILFFEKFLVFGKVHQRTNFKKIFIPDKGVKEATEAVMHGLLKENIWLSFPSGGGNDLLEFVWKFVRKKLAGREIKEVLAAPAHYCL